MESRSPSGRPSEHGSKRRMVASSQSAPSSPKASSTPDISFENSFGKSLSGRIGDSAPRSRNATPLTASTPLANGNSRTFHPDASLVLVGVRGCGKRSLGFIAATALGRRFITEDHFFQTATGVSRQDYLKVHGSQEFHKRDVEISRRMLDENRFKCVIECGLSSLTKDIQDHLKRYSQTNPVVHLVRDMSEIKHLLRLTDRSARMLENGDATHQRCSNFEFYNLADTSTDGFSENGDPDRLSPNYSFKLKEAKEDFSYLSRFITGASVYRPDSDSPFSLSEVPVDRRLYSHALEIPLSLYQDGKIDLAQLESGGDVVEILVDSWTSKWSTVLSKLVADIRRKIAVPIILSAKRGQQNISDTTYVAILEQGLRLGVEFLSIDLDLDSRQITSLVNSKGHTRIIGHFLDTIETPAGWESDQWLTRYNQAERLRCDVVRLLKIAASREDNEMLGRFTHKIRGRAGLSPPLIAYNVGVLGRTSQIFNHILTAVTHPALERVRASSEAIPRPLISSREAVQALFHSFVLDPLKFFILGGNVSNSLSPAIHNAAYNLLGMDHTYQTKNISSIDEIDILAQDPHTGGFAIIQPFKTGVVGRLTSKSRHAEAIGAVNTILPLRAEADGSVPPLDVQANQRNRAGRITAWHGENTDWIGITVCLNRGLSPRNVIQPLKTTGLVIGAGGMARAAVYAMLKMGCKAVFVYNRTTSNAELLAAHFNKWAGAGLPSGDSAAAASVRILKSTEDPWPSGFAMPTMIVSCVTQETLEGKTAANFEIPSQWLQSQSGGVVIEMAYNTADTPLIKQIKQVRQDTAVPWVLVTGLETLPEQAIAQFELMTGRKAPQGCIRKAVRDSWSKGVAWGQNGS